MELVILGLIFLAAFASSFIGSLVGGGSLIITSVLLALNVPALDLIGSRRVAAIGGNLGSWIRYAKQKKVDYKLALILLPACLIGVYLGYWLVDYFKELNLRFLIGIVLFALLAVQVIRDLQGSRVFRFSNKLVQHFLGTIGGFISSVVNNVSGAGGGMLLAYTLLLVYGKSILHTAGTSKFMLLLSNAFAATLFIRSDYIDYELAGIMLVGHFFGGWLGARFYLKLNQGVLKIFLYGVVILMILRVLAFSD